MFVVGIFLLAYGLVTIFSNRYNRWIRSRLPDSELDKKWLLPKSINFFRRNDAGFRFAFIGLILIVLSVAILTT